MTKILTRREVIENMCFREIKTLAYIYASSGYSLKRQTEWLLEHWLNVLEAIEDNTYSTPETRRI